LNASSGLLSGTPTQTGTYQVAVTEKDTSAAGQATATKTLALQVVAPAIAISIPSVVGRDGALISGVQATATGGVLPYKWSLVNSPPAGLTINPSTGALSWSNPSCGVYSLTLQVTDSAATPTTVQSSQSVAIGPTLTISSLTTPVQPMVQPALSLSLGAACNTAISGTLTLAFQSAVNGATDPTILFGNGSTSTPFTIAANSTAATFTASSGNLLQTGSVAGTITLTAATNMGAFNVTQTTNSTSGGVQKSTPVVVSGYPLAQRSGSTITVTVKGYSTTRDLQTASFTFTIAGGSPQTVQVSLSSAASTYYGSSASTPYGSQFLYTQPFTVAQGDATTITTVAVALSNSSGTSPVQSTAQVQ
jgi:hypothetical protein